MPRLSPDLDGRAFGRLTVTARALADRHGRARWACRCSCGSETVIAASALTSGHTRSCGCLRREMVATGALRRTHGARRTAEYRTWCSVIQRCTNRRSPGFAKYGAKGVTVCKRWRESFEAFFADMGPRPRGCSIDRIDNSRGYEAGNCRWATAHDQARNKTTNVLNTEMVMEIKQRLRAGATTTDVSNEFGISLSTASKVKCGVTWADVDGPDGDYDEDRQAQDDRIAARNERADEEARS